MKILKHTLSHQQFIDTNLQTKTTHIPNLSIPKISKCDIKILKSNGKILRYLSVGICFLTDHSHQYPHQNKHSQYLQTDLFAVSGFTGDFLSELNLSKSFQNETHKIPAKSYKSHKNHKNPSVEDILQISMSSADLENGLGLDTSKIDIKVSRSSHILKDGFQVNFQFSKEKSFSKKGKAENTQELGNVSKFESHAQQERKRTNYKQKQRSHRQHRQIMQHYPQNARFQSNFLNNQNRRNVNNSQVNFQFSQNQFPINNQPASNIWNLHLSQIQSSPISQNEFLVNQVNTPFFFIF